MAHTTLFLFAVLGCLSLGLGSKRRGDSGVIEELSELKSLIKDMEAKVNETDAKNGDLKALEKRLNATEKELEKVKTDVQLLKKENEDIMAKLNDTVEELEKIKQNGSKTTEGPKVAFSVSLAASGETYLKDSDASPNVVYKRIFTNAGKAYDSKKGTFTAPVKGIYFFSFSTFGYNNFLSGAILTKNGEYMVSSYDAPSTGDVGDTGGNSVILQLEKGEQVSMKLWEKSQVFDNLNGHTTFSGFLLFPL
ncbi:cerebellin-1-like [Sardina pilchardus]|uniref:cerebellin-1-like n=1 Tax=Sardina pilchardus TaxID=27697 RepID=UPI002E156520